MAEDNSVTTFDCNPFVSDQLSSEELSFLMDVCNLTNSQENQSNDLLTNDFDQLSVIETSQYGWDMSHSIFVQSEVSNKNVSFDDSLFSEIGNPNLINNNESASCSDLSLLTGLFDNDNSIGQVISVNEVTNSNVFKGLSDQKSSEYKFSGQLSSFQTSSVQLSFEAMPSDATTHNGVSPYQSSPSQLSSQSSSEWSDYFLLTPGYFKSIMD